MPPKPAAVTLQTIAKALNLSPSTVSQVLNPRKNSTRVGTATAERVLALARDWNYRPDINARALASSRSHIIGYCELFSGVDYLLFPVALRGINVLANQHGYRVELVAMDSPQEDWEKAFRTIRDLYRLDGLILTCMTSLDPSIIEALEASGLPFMLLNLRHEVGAVYVDDVFGGHAITEHLISQGHRRITYLVPSTVDQPYDHYSLRDRQAGYKAAMEEAGLKPKELKIQDIHGDLSEVAKWRTKPSWPEAFFCYNDYVALKVAEVLYRQRLFVPDAVSLCGYNNTLESRTPIPLTTMDIPYYEMGTTVLEQLMRQIEHGTPREPSVSFKPELVVRDSSLRA